jgi:peptidoglycan/xylan/chitin deacetylase (PgdA/CDA1 family)
MLGFVKNIYGRGRDFLPKPIKGRITRMLYEQGFKPSVSPAKTSFDKGVVVLSADFEMAWAFQYSKNLAARATEQGLLERENVPKIISLLDQYDIPVTWATVGHLFLKSCIKENDKVHPEMPRPEYFENRNWNFNKGDWYQHDPGTNYKENPAWYAPDLIDKILSSNIDHEIGCHTFSHIDFTDKNCPPELAEAEIQKCKALASEKNISLQSIVFPGGTEGNHEILKKHGISCYRKPMEYDIDIPKKDKYGLVAIPSSYGMDKPQYNWSKETCFKIAKSFIDKASRHKKVCHLWFHPSMDPWYLKYIFPEILKYIAEKREKNEIDVMTMGEIAEKFLNQ